MSRIPQCGYDAVAETYDRRYAVHPLAGVERALRTAARRQRVRRALEVGCGSGHWLARLADTVPLRVGADLSLGMLRVAGRADRAAHRVRCRAERPPFAAGGFDLVYSINALHQFDDQEGCVRLAAQRLQPGGLLLLVGLDPHRADHHWYLYEFFPAASKPTSNATLRRGSSSIGCGRQNCARSPAGRSKGSPDISAVARFSRIISWTGRRHRSGCD